MVFRETARVVAPDTLSTYTFVEWLAHPLTDTREVIRSPSVAMNAPEVVQLVHYDRMPSHVAPFTRRNLFLRDEFTCQYCGRQCGGDHLSIDHILPKSRGGHTSWENCVLACIGCNARKGSRTLKEAGLHLLRQPTRPRWSPYLNLRPNQRLDSWAQFSPEFRRRAAHGM